MSFQDLARGGGQELRPYGDSPQPNKEVAQVEQSIFRLRTELVRVKAEVDRLGTTADTLELRHRVQSACLNISSYAKKLGSAVHKLHEELNTKKTARLVTSFQDALRDVQVTLETAKSREASIPPRKPQTAATLPPDIDLEAGPDTTEQQALLQQQQQQEAAVLTNQLDYQEALIEERDQGIAEIQRSIADVHEIFQDLATLTHDQGLMIDDIDANVTHVAARTQEANKELVKAEKSQRSARMKKCLLLFIVIVVLVVLCLILLS